MDLRKLKTLIDLVAESSIAEIEVTEGEDKVKIIKHAPATTAQVALAPVPTIAAAAALPLAPAVPAPALAAPPPAEVAEAPKGTLVKSPMVGTFYRSSSPGGKPLVDVGQTVNEGDTLCIIEAMKLLNEIESEVAGVIKEVFIENGQPVEFGQPLFRIE
jgi:acetyl-CoA carboxylase biotin carboxyl carrier protein